MVKPVSKGPKRYMTISIVDDFFLNNASDILPPLYLQINPQRMAKEYRKKITRFQTFASHVEQYWGDELDSISVSNTTGAFYTPERGLSHIDRHKSEAYENFKQILDIYRANGNTYDNKGQVVNKGSVIISFNPDNFWGYFESFTWKEDATSPFRFTFDFVFKVQKTYTGF